MREIEEEKVIALGCDHGGFHLALSVKEFLEESGYKVQWFGCVNGESVDYPDVAKETCTYVLKGKAKFGILICGTGIGMSIAANKIKGIRAAACSETFSAKYTRAHNDSNVLCLGGRVIGKGIAMDMINLFLKTQFEGGRHQRRVDAVMALEK